jgi:hypothetical protein
MADHKWSAEQTLGNTALVCQFLRSQNATMNWRMEFLNLDESIHHEPLVLTRSYLSQNECDFCSFGSILQTP